MKKVYLLLLLTVVLFSNAAYNQCTNTSAFGTTTAPTTPTPVTITTCAFAGEYSTINNCVAGTTYQFNATGGAGNYITIRQGTPGGTVLGFGTAPVTVTCTVSGPLYLHYNTNASCGTDAACHTGTVTCTSCSAPPPVANDLCTGAININCGQTINATTVGATADADPACGTTQSTAPGVWYSFTGDGLSNVISLCGSSFDTKLFVYTGTCGALTCVTGNDDFCGLQSQVTVPTTLGTTYYIRVTGFGSASGNFTLARTCIPAIPNDVCSGAININCGQTITGTTVGASSDAVATCVTTLSSAPGVWYSFVGTGTDNTLSLCGSSYDTKIGVFTGTCGSLVCVTGNDDFCGLQSQVTVPNTIAGTTYYVLVTGFGSASGAFTLTRTCAPPPNDVCANAVNINCGQTITGTTALGTPDAVPTCGTTLNTAPGLWYRFTGDGSPVTMSLCGSSYDTKIGVFTGTCGTFTCVAGNDDFCGTQSQVTFNTNAGITYYVLVTGFSTNSGNFSLTRTCAPACSGVPSPGAITPASSAVCIGSSVTLTVSGYSANSGLAFQWKESPTPGGPYTNIPGATGNIYTFTAAAPRYYTCTVTCTSPGGGAGTTAEVFVNVGNPVHTSLVATPSTVCSPGSVTISGTVSGGIGLGNYTHTLTGPGTIGAPVTSGPNNSNVSFSVTNIPAGNQTYTLTSTDGNGCSKSTTVAVLVNLTPVVTLSPASATICNGDILPITGTVTTGAGTVVYSPVTELYTNAAATTAYTGTALASGTIIYAKPTVTRTYTATVTSAQGCSSSTPITVTVNQLPAITVQPQTLSAPVCPGFNVNYSVTATGTGLTYQWQISTDNGATWTNLVNNGTQYAGVTTTTLNLLNVQTTQNSHRFRVIVSGVCPPPVTSNSVTLVVATPPTITTQPANLTVCAGTNATFNVVATGVPAPNIYQWQVSTNGGVTWTNLTTGGSYTPTLTVSPTTTALNNNRYRVIVTNSCGQNVTSNAAILTVNPLPVVSATDLWTRRICISDTLVPLVGTPTGGSWSGIGVSGFNFVPTATAIGTYTLTYTFTNSFGCTATDTTKAIVVDCPERIRLLRDNAVVLFPNPNNGQFNIRINSVLYNYLGMNVYTSTGLLVSQKTFSGLAYGRVVPIDLTHLPSGVYMVKFFYDDGIRTSEKAFQVIIGRQ